MRRVFIKLYYRFWNLFLPKIKFDMPISLLNEKSLFIYFDYEREFSGYNTYILDEDISLITKYLKDLNIRTTWFTVGKIFEKYPNSIKEILHNGNEIGSHTFNHIPPLKASCNHLKQDFQQFNEKSQEYCRIKGFHSPHGQWAVKMMKCLRQYDFFYDVSGTGKKGSYNPYILKLGLNHYLVRLKTLGDDWYLYKRHLNQVQVFEYLIANYNKLKPGEICGIGFHPWILLSDTNILNGFREFLNFIKNQENIRIEPADYYIQEITQNLKFKV